MDFFSVLTLLGGLAMFLYGMNVMGDGLEKVSGGKLEKILENPQVIKTPVVRNGKQSTLGYQPDVWKKWE